MAGDASPAQAEQADTDLVLAVTAPPRRLAPIPLTPPIPSIPSSAAPGRIEEALLIRP
ncbi:MAG: hypothetical protein R2755_29495 [Acidimicrobiales bacterium]